MLPHEVKLLSKSAATSRFYVSNIYFMLISDYFNPALTRDPLLHTWSLSVEEQYYNIIPAFMVAIFTFRKSILISCFISFGVL